MNDQSPYLEDNQKSEYNGNQTSVARYGCLSEKLSVKATLFIFAQETCTCLRNSKDTLVANGGLDPWQIRRVPDLKGGSFSPRGKRPLLMYF